MTLRQLRDRMSLLQIAIASLAVVLGGGMQYPSLAIAAGLTLWAFWRPLPEELSKRNQRLWTLGIFVALVGTLARAFLRAEFLDAGVDFLLLLIVQRFFNRQRAREHLQLLMLGTLMMIVGAVVNTDLTYPMLLLAYLVVAVMTLIVNHLLAEGERLGARVQGEVARAAIRSRRTLWRAALGVAAMGAVGALVVFLLFPRFGAGVFLRGAMARDMQTGFSGFVQLGGFGRIKSDATVIARLEPLTFVERPERLIWHLRGSTFDAYENGRWSLSRDGIMTPLKPLGGYRVLMPGGSPRMDLAGRGRGAALVPRRVDGFAASGETIRVRVLLEDLGVDPLFVASDPLAVRVDPRGSVERNRLRVQGGFNLDLKVDKPQPGPVQYEFWSRIGEPTEAELRALGDQPAPAELAVYVEKATSLSDQATELARELTANADTRYDKVMAVMDHLGTFTYTTDLEASEMIEAGADPVDAFLFEKQEGHCEYFASALAVLLREVDIPTRLVNGYYGAHYNDIGDYYAVRQADAHSWVEVWMGDPIGWVTFDPTPPSGRMAGDDAPFLPALSQAVDALRNAYLEYVIDYNLSKQMSLLENMGVREEGTVGGTYRVQWRGVLVWGIGIACVGAGVWWWRRRRVIGDPPAVRLYGKLLVRLSARGHRREPSESPSRFARRLVQQEVPGAEDFARFARLYEEHRFGPELPASVLAELREHASAVARMLR